MGANRIAPNTRTKQGFEAMVGMHCIATLLFTDLLRPQLRAAAASQPPGAVRVVWTSSFLAEGGSPVNGVDFTTLEKGTDDRILNYAVSKAGTWMLGREMARRYAADGILSVVQNPGNLKAGSYEGTPALTMCLVRPLLYDARFGAYTELYCGLSPEITTETNGAYVIPWGRVRPDKDCPRRDIINAMTPVEEGGLGHATKFWEWCEEQWRPFIETTTDSSPSAHT
ncbi:uncharacterized protein LDX57_012064 [Aspergillus melleus]|uniref:uncharacterized protein n=1 Tax=Aspergillus melleus TaxID=138277 RepID=UPI001E8DE6C2|nr:uncharacterized protein LDX57_012064 [Aspergillus melleus]KAH8434417.1 hypothetical protein LDX57_012064 [Aspergillus melleus]